MIYLCYLIMGAMLMSLGWPMTAVVAVGMTVMYFGGKRPNTEGY